jgi:hypothetical protein
LQLAVGDSVSTDVFNASLKKQNLKRLGLRWCKTRNVERQWEFRSGTPGTSCWWDRTEWRCERRALSMHSSARS